MTSYCSRSLNSIRQHQKLTPQWNRSTSNESLNTIPYDTGNRFLALLGLIFSLIAGLVFVIIGVAIYIISPSHYNRELAKGSMPLLPDIYKPETEGVIFIPLSDSARAAIELLMSALVTVCTEATGYVHSTTLKWGLAKEGRLTFNANLRLFSATKGVFSPSGPVVNALFGISTIAAYATSTTFLLPCSLMNVHGHFVPWALISFLPPIIFGSMIILQAVLGFISFYTIPIYTWSSSPLDTASALVYHRYIYHRPKRCMRSVSKTNDSRTDPIHPSPRQPSSLSSHKSVALVVSLVWGVAAVWFIAGAFVYCRTDGGGELVWWGMVPPSGLLWGTSLLAMTQSILTIMLHCCELVTSLSRDEVIWRAASSVKGARPAGNPLKTVIGSWETVGLLVAKPVIHWLFGNAVALEAGIGFLAFPKHMLFLAVGVVLLAVFITVVAIHHPSGTQPAAYGHLQTLADLVDQWSTTMYWGHKGNGWAVGALPVRHAGTTNEGLLPPVGMDSIYA
ncbi:hypothetical protein FRB97_004298 [Tulasnella sp. 331]|nr:hypothetical protein FRB97_004298 [Tulasnella sp. 331]